MQELAICSPLMIVLLIARLTHAERVHVSVLVPTFSGLEIAAEVTVAGLAKVLGVVLPLGVLALGNTHTPLTHYRLWQLLLPLLVGNRSRLPHGTDFSNVDRIGGGH